MPGETPTKPVSCCLEFILKTYYTDFDLLLVVGGYKYPDSLTDVELVTLDRDNFPVPPCLTNLKELPFASYAMAGAVDEYGNPFICGGVQEYSDKCYKYDPQADTWELLGTMPNLLSYVADTVVPGLGLVMVGGDDGTYPNDGTAGTDEVIATTDGVTFQELAPLPEPSYQGENQFRNTYMSICINIFSQNGKSYHLPVG